MAEKLTRAVCVGGPADGRTLTGQYTDRLAVTDAKRTHAYRLERIQGEHQRFNLWVHDTLKPDDVLLRLLSSYAAGES